MTPLFHGSKSVSHEQPQDQGEIFKLSVNQRDHEISYAIDIIRQTAMMNQTFELATQQIVQSPTVEKPAQPPVDADSAASNDNRTSDKFPASATPVAELKPTIYDAAPSTIQPEAIASSEGAELAARQALMQKAYSDLAAIDATRQSR